MMTMVIVITIVTVISVLWAAWFFTRAKKRNGKIDFEAIDKGYISKWCNKCKSARYAEVDVNICFVCAGVVF